MRVVYALLAEAAMLTQDQRLSVLGAGIFALAFPTVPAAMARLDLAFKLEFSPDEVGREFTLHVDLVDADGKQLAEVLEGDLRIRPEAWPDDMAAIIHDVPPFLDVVVHFPRVGFPATGRYNLRIIIDGKQLDQVPLLILRAPAPAPTGGSFE